MVKKPITKNKLEQCEKCKRWFTVRAIVEIKKNNWCRDCHSNDTKERLKEVFD